MPVRLTESYLRRVIRQELKEIFNMDKFSSIIDKTYRAFTSDDNDSQSQLQDYQNKILNSNEWLYTIKPLLIKYGSEFRNYITGEFRALLKTGGGKIDIFSKFKGGADKQIVFPENVDNQTYAQAFLEVIKTLPIYFQ